MVRSTIKCTLEVHVLSMYTAKQLKHAATENPVIMQIHAHVLVLAIYVQACTNKKTSNTHTLSIAKNKPLKTGAKISY